MTNSVNFTGVLKTLEGIQRKQELTRKALLICCPGIRGNNYIAGIEKDITDFDRFLRSPQGGLWNKDEIIPLSDPNEKELLPQIETLAGYDYSLVVFSGHGESVKGTTMLALRGNDAVDAIKLRRGSNRQTVIIDCCRVIQDRILLEETQKTAVAKTLRVLDPERCRSFYDKWIMACGEKALVVTNACRNGEEAQAHPTQGSYYIQALINESNAWVRNWQINEQGNGLSIVAAHDRAAAIVEKEIGGRQHPEILVVPKGKYAFPFCVAT